MNIGSTKDNDLVRPPNCSAKNHTTSALTVPRFQHHNKSKKNMLRDVNSFPTKNSAQYRNVKELLQGRTSKGLSYNEFSHLYCDIQVEQTPIDARS